MSFEQQLPELPGMVPIDLMNFNDDRLSSAGELTLGNELYYDVILKLGGDILSLSRIAIPEDGPYTRAPDSAYILRNLTAADPSRATVLFDSLLRDAGQLMLVDGKELAVMAGSIITIGRSQTATPGLQLSNTVSRRHARLRIGALQRNLHVMDLESTNGTTAYLAPSDAQGLDHQRREYRMYPDCRTTEQVNGRWTRC